VRLSKFEKYQQYITSWKSLYLKALAVKFRNELLDLETEAEVIFKSYLIKLGIKYEFQKIIFAGKSFYIVDFYLPKKSLVIEVDGYHHSNEEIKTKDDLRTGDLKKVGVKKVIRFKNGEIYNEFSCINKIKKYVL
jgi:very-short-patch-repair endonuclease